MPFTPFGSTALANIEQATETAGFSTGALTRVDPATAANTKASTFTQLAAGGTGGVVVNDLAGFWLLFNQANGVGNRYLTDLYFGAAGSEVLKIDNLYTAPGTAAGGPDMKFVPLNVPAGTRLSMKTSSSGASGQLSAGIVGLVRNAQSWPLFDNCERVTSNPTGTFAAGSDCDLTGVTAANTGWTTVATLARKYGAAMMSVGVRSSGTVPANTQQGSVRLGLGGSGATDATLFARTQGLVGASNPAVPKFPSFPIYKPMTTGQRLAAEFLAAASDVVQVQVHLFY